MAWDLDLWADAEHAKIAERAAEHRRAFEPPPDPLAAFCGGLRNMTDAELALVNLLQWGGFGTPYVQQIGRYGDAMAGPNLLTALFGVVWQ